MQTLVRVALASLALSLLTGCAVTFGQMGAGAACSEFKPVGLALGASAGADQRTFTGLRDTVQFGGHAHADLAWNLPGNVASVGVTAQHWLHSFDEAGNVARLHATGVGPMAWLKLAPGLNLSAAVVPMTSRYSDGEGIFYHGGRGMGGPDVTRVQAEIDFTRVEGLMISGVHLGVHQNTIQTQTLAGLRREFKVRGAYVEAVIGRY